MLKLRGKDLQEQSWAALWEGGIASALELLILFELAGRLGTDWDQ